MKGRRSRLAWLLLSLFWIVAPRAALAYGDCPMVGTLEGFDASAEPQITHYDAREVAVADANGSRREIKKGEVCKQRYDMKEGAPPLSALEIMQNYAQGLPALGLKITNVDRADDGEIFAVGTNHGAEYWAHVWQDYGTSIKVETLTAAPFQSSLLPHAASACPIVPALAGFSADEAPKIVNYAAMEMHVVDGDEEKTIVKKGKLCKQRYDMKE
ncbi:MAG: hypothetical protein ABSC22_04890, partial [Roseiarcus sp.]